MKLPTPELRNRSVMDVVQAIAGAGNWDVEGDDAGRVVWARLAWAP